MDITTSFSRSVLPLAAAPKPGAAATPVPRGGVPIVWAHIKAPRGHAFARARGGMSRGAGAPSGMVGVGGAGGTLAPQRGWGWLRAADWDALGCGCPGCSGECGSHGNAVGLDAGWALLYHRPGPPLPLEEVASSGSSCSQRNIRREDAAPPARRDGHTDTTGWTGRHGGMDTQSPNPLSVHPSCPLPVAVCTNSWDPTTSQPLAGREAMS